MRRSHYSYFKETFMASMLGSLAGSMLAQIFNGSTDVELLKEWEKIAKEQLKFIHESGKKK